MRILQYLLDLPEFKYKYSNTAWVCTVSKHNNSSYGAVNNLIQPEFLDFITEKFEILVNHDYKNEKYLHGDNKGVCWSICKFI